jgi:nodulation protein E
MANAGASRLSVEVGIQGPGLTISTACASASHAIGIAYSMVAQGAVPLAIAGGSEAPFSLGHLKAWDSLRVVSSELCRPFSRERKGLVLGEGAGALVLEPLEDALARHAHVRAEIVGFGMSSDADHITRPSAIGAARAIRAALASAALEPGAVDYINAHGTGTVLNDATESKAVRDVFGCDCDSASVSASVPASDGPLVSSTKSMHGHALGASGALEAVATVLALEHQVVPPNANYLGPDEDCSLRIVPNESKAASLDVALSSSFAFGGLNAVLALRRA